MSKISKPKMMGYSRQVMVCIGAKCTKNNEGLTLYNELKEKLKAVELSKGELRILRSKVTCLGTCSSGPLVCVQPDGVWYYDINSEKLDRIIEQHLIQGNPVSEFMYYQQS